MEMWSCKTSEIQRYDINNSYLSPFEEKSHPQYYMFL